MPATIRNNPMKREQPLHSASPEDAELRMRAKERLHEQARAGKPPASQHADNPQRLLHELQVHQVELQLQNEQLEAARAWIEAALGSYTELYDFAPVPYLTLGPTGAIVEANLAGARLLGVERARLLDKRLGAFVAEADRGRFAAFLKSAFATASDVQCEVVLVAKDGTGSTVEIRATLANDGASVRIVLIDVSAQRARERHLARLGDVFMLAREAMFLTDQDGIITDINHAFSAATGYERAQVVGQHQRLLRCDNLAPDLDPDGSWSGMVRLRCRDGAEHLVRQDTSAMRERDGTRHYVSRFAPG
jgi:PAS domain S-box-containing protein